MVNLRIITVLVMLVAWWQKGTLEDRALTHDGFTAPLMQNMSRAWSAATPPSPAKAWTSARDEWMDDLFNPKQDHSRPAVDHLAPTTNKEPLLRPDPPHATSIEKKPNDSNTPVSLGSVMDPKKTPRTPFNSLDTPLEKKADAAASDSKILDSKSLPEIKRILIVGDSMSGDVGLSLRQLAFKYKQNSGVDVQIIDAHRHSTGLVVPSYYDWPQELPIILKKNEPQVVVFMAGANDGQSMRLENKTWVLPGSPEWSAEYARRARQVVATIPPSAKLVWLDLPPVRLKSLQEKTLQVNDSVKDALTACTHCMHLETRSTFGGKTYVENTPGSILRAKDGVHYSRTGASFVATQIWKTIGLPLIDLK